MEGCAEDFACDLSITSSGQTRLCDYVAPGHLRFWCSRSSCTATAGHRLAGGVLKAYRPKTNVRIKFPLLPAVAKALIADLRQERPPAPSMQHIFLRKNMPYERMTGAAIRYRILHDGRRQVLNIALPGDFIGFPSTFFEKALYSVTAITQSPEPRDGGSARPIGGPSRPRRGYCCRSRIRDEGDARAR